MMAFCNFKASCSGDALSTNVTKLSMHVNAVSKHYEKIPDEFIGDAASTRSQYVLTLVHLKRSWIDERILC